MTSINTIFIVFSTLSMALFLGQMLPFADGTRVQISGTLHCSDPHQSMANVGIELWERDFIDPDDKLNQTKSAGDGTFTISGEDSEFFGSIEPYLAIQHSCAVDVGEKNCKYRNVIKLELKEKDGLMKKEGLEVKLGKNGEKPEKEECPPADAASKTPPTEENEAASPPASSPDESEDSPTPQKLSASSTASGKNGTSSPSNAADGLKIMNAFASGDMAADLSADGTQMPSNETEQAEGPAEEKPAEEKQPGDQEAEEGGKAVKLPEDGAEKEAEDGTETTTGTDEESTTPNNEGEANGPDAVDAEGAINGTGTNSNSTTMYNGVGEVPLSGGGNGSQMQPQQVY